MKLRPSFTEEGQTVTATCKVRPKPVIVVMEWYHKPAGHSEKRLIATNKWLESQELADRFMVELQTSASSLIYTLTFNATPADEGQFFCQATTEGQVRLIFREFTMDTVQYGNYAGSGADVCSVYSYGLMVAIALVTLAGSVFTLIQVG